MTACFLCGKDIEGKITKEHIFGDAFLGEYNLKEKKMNYGGKAEIEYSRLKVPAHHSCNSETGSRFEEYILSIIKNISLNLDVMRELHTPQHSKTAACVKEVLCQWLVKIYLGLSYWELSRINHPNKEYQHLLNEVIQTPLTGYLQTCFSNEYTFNCPSSLYYFSVPYDSDHDINFDFATRHDVGGAYIKFGPHLLVATLADARLVEHWFNDSLYESVQTLITNETESDAAAYLLAVGHVWAVREYLPIEPKLEFTENSIIDTSRDGYDLAPEIDGKAVNRRAIELRNEMVERFLGQP